MNETRRNFAGEPIFTVETPFDVVLAHGLAKGMAAFDEFCTKVLNEQQTRGTAGRLIFDLRGADPQEIVTQAKQILWGNEKKLGLVAKCALCTNITDISTLTLESMANLQRNGEYTLAEAIGSFCHGFNDATSGYDLSVGVANIRRDFPHLLP